MHLIALRLRGFKSFAEATELRFWPGVAVVVGPNGSGKSNIADALQWAMASQPPSQLRAQTGQDVLFAGSDTRAPCGICEVELVLANDGRIALPHDEVSVMRRVRRDGEGEYLLNRAQVRRLDVQEALADAGLGRELHCVVSQGSVDAILLSRPEERRGLVEEAAGLGKYKRRRQRAQLKLARVRADLERAADIEREIRARLRPLELQASAAERAAGLARDIAEGRLRLLGSEGAALRTRRASLADDRERARERVLELEAVLEAARARREGAEAELASLASEQERASSRAWALEAGRERLVGRVERLRERLADAARESDGERERATRLSGQASRSRAAAEAAGASAARLAGEAGRLRADEPAAELAAHTTRAADALEQALAARRAAAEAEGGAARAGSERARGDARLAALHEAAATRAAALGAATSALEAAEGEVAGAMPGTAEAEADLTACLAAAELAGDAADVARAGERAALAAGAQAAERATAAVARVEALDEALRRADGVAPAVRRLAERGALLSVSLVSAPAGVERAVAAALACRAAAVADDIDAAIALLHGEDMDGASVLVARGRQPGPVAAPPGARALAGVATADTLAPPGLLDAIWLVDGPAAFAGVEHGLAVTPDGLCYDAEAGVVSRPGAAGEAALLSGRRELAGARAEAERAGRLARGAEAEVDTARTALAAADAGAAGTRADLAAAHERLARAEGRLRDAGATLQAARHALERVRQADAAASAEAGDLQVQLAALAGDERALAAAAAQAARDASEADARYREHEQQRRALAERDARRRADLAALEERIGRVRADAEREAAGAVQAEAAAHAAAMRADTLSALVAIDSSGLVVLNACVAAGARAAVPARAALAGFEARAAGLSGVLRECGEEEARQGSLLRDLSARATTCEVELAQIEERHADVRRRARELSHAHRLAIVDAVEPMEPDAVTTLAIRLERLERRHAEFGAVNPLARQEYDEQRVRADEVAEQRSDLDASLRELDALIRELTATIAERFDATFERVREGFAEVIGTLFPGGRGRIRLVEPDAASEDDEAGDRPASIQSEPGIDVEVQPAGKRISSLGLLSGGERSLAALGFLFALLLARPSPFYVLDEVDAALDDANIERFLELVERFRDRAQFIVVTHQKRTMDIADVLYGVSMAGDGVSKVLSRRVAREPVAT